MNSTLPVAIIGAGPVGLAAAAHLIKRGETPIVLEAGASVGAGVRCWGHVQLFSPWRYVVDTAAAELLQAAGWQTPDPDSFPTGADLVARYLEPLAALPAVAPLLRLGTRVVAISRDGYDKQKSAGRADAPFLIQAQRRDGTEEYLLARAVIDASGTSGSPNPLGASGLPAIGEDLLAERIAYGTPDLRGAARKRYAGQRVLVVGSGHSAFNALLDLAALAQEEPGTQIHWAIRRTQLGQLYGGGAADLLPARGLLGLRLRELVTAGTVQLHTGVQAARISDTQNGLVVQGRNRALPPVDTIIVATGFRPDLAPLRELRLALDPTTESPVALAPLIDPNLHSCGSVPPHGAAELAHPEPDFYIVGMKSYGRAPTFLMLTGYEQVRSIACALTGDAAGAAAVELVLPETGVCSGPLGAGGTAGGCCGAPVAPPQRTAAAAIPLTPSARGTKAEPVLMSVAVGAAEPAACCSATAQAECCAPEDKAGCCGVAGGATCGCQ